MTDDAFFLRLADMLGGPVLQEEERAAVLDLTRIVAHRTERRYAPLTAYALALTLGAEDPAERLRRVRDLARRLDPPDGQPDGSADPADPAA